MIINILKDCKEVNMIGGIYRAYRKDFCGYMAEKALTNTRLIKVFWERTDILTKWDLPLPITIRQGYATVR